ncbi:hypothetical protein [Streptomyces sp. MK7]|uniref:hypothetical protein n=1 Tax=Streptomyces sp. MK7 TaxID=3067635 RepID=UPI00292F4849|nr:hypothetical protein [Streptomyces sp. MK7]
MTTRPSPPQSDQSVISFTEEFPWAGPPGGTAGGGEGAGERADGDAASGLMRAAVGDRSVEEVARLVTLLRESPEYADAAGPVLRAVAVDRPVEEVARLVAELTRPPYPADSADDTIRAAVEHRCVEDVTRLVTLLHREPQLPHCGREAVRAAADARSSEDLVELIGRLARDRDPARPPGADRAPVLPGEEPMTGPTGPGDHSGAPDEPEAEGTDSGTRRPGGWKGRLAFWPSWLAAAALVVCGAAHFPLRREGAPVYAYGTALAASALCGALALALTLRPGVAVLVAGAVVPGALAALGYVEGRFASAELSRALAITLAPPASAGLTAVCASLASLAALSLLLMVHVAERHPAPRPSG